MADAIVRFKGRNEVQQLLEAVDTLTAVVNMENDNRLEQDIAPALNFLDDKKADKVELDQFDQAINLLDNRTAGYVETKKDLVDAVNTLDNNKAQKAATVASADATDLATALTLLNEIKTKINLMNG